MAGCGGRRPNMEEEADGRSVEMPPVPAAQQVPESLDDPSAAPHQDDQEHSPEKNQEFKRTFFTKAQVKTLEACFKKKEYPSISKQEELAKQLRLPLRSIQFWFINRRRREKKQKKIACRAYVRTAFTEEQLNALEASFKENLYLTLSQLEQLANQLSLPEKTIQNWFKNRRKKWRHQPLTSHPDSKYHPHTGSKTPTDKQLDVLHKQNMESTINCVQAQKASLLDMFPPQRPMDSCMLPQGPHSSDMVYCQNVVGPPESCCGTEVSKIPPKSGHELPNDYLLNVSLPNKTIKPGTSVLTPESSITTNLTSNNGPSTSSAPSASKMTIAQDNFNLPETNIWNPGSSITTDLTFYDELSIFPGPSTSPMPIAWYNADERSSTVTTPLIPDESTDSD